MSKENCINCMGNQFFVGGEKPGVTVNSTEVLSGKKQAKAILGNLDGESLPPQVEAVRGAKKRFKETWGYLSNASPDDFE